MSVSAPPPVSGFSSTLQTTVNQNLGRQLSGRFVAVFVMVALVGNLVALASYLIFVQRAQRASADATARHVEKNYAQMSVNWLRDAEEMKTQIDFMRIFDGSQKENWLRLRSYIAALEGKADRFAGGVVFSDQGRPLFFFGPDGQSMGQRLEGEKPGKRWFYGSEHRTAYALVSVPLWLGPQGMGRLVLMRSLDAGVLRSLVTPGAHLLLAYNGRVLASSRGSEEIGQPVDSTLNGRLNLNGRRFEQRMLAPMFDDPAAPSLVLQEAVGEPLSMWIVLGASSLLMAVLALFLWYVIGRWLSQQVERVGQLSRATSLFAEEHAMGKPLQRALAEAGQQSDEIGDVAESLHILMQSVLAHDREHFAYLQTLEILEEAVVELGPDGRYLLASPGWSRLAGQPRQTGGVIYDSIHPDDEEGFRKQFEQLLSGDKNSLTGRMRLRRSDAKEIWIEYRFVTGETGGHGVASVRGVLRDITQSYQLEKHVNHMALHDALTGLPNRVLLEDRCKIALRTAERSGHKVALGFMDLDHFKHVNDQFGHKAGDELLMALSSALRQCLRAGDTLARWGGDEFVVLLTEINGMDDAHDAIAKLEAICGNPIKIEGNEFNPTFSMGVAMYPDDANTVETLLSQADRAMFSAKQQGRNTVRFFADIAHREQDRKALYIQNRLATAIKEQQIQTWFQPIVDANTLQVVSCEALARWHDETYGWVSPATFVPMAENLGLIREIGQQVWKQAIDSLHRWRQMGMDMKISVNVSRRQLFTPSFTADLLEDLDRLAIPVSVVDLEITESVAMEDAEHTTKRLAELTEAGFGIAIDDFGTGYSSLSQLHDMPASKIKIDISFVRRAHGEQGGQLIQAIVKIASAFKLHTVAEGVEDFQTADVLRSFGVDRLQGYHFGKPMNAESFERYLRDSLKKA
jgi:diguanylate cyclase (GGDEF)-like protein/PAS domain S-box-containing protein